MVKLCRLGNVFEVVWLGEDQGNVKAVKHFQSLEEAFSYIKDILA